MQSRVYQWVARRLVWAAGETICTRRPMLRARLFLAGLALILAAGSWRPASTLAQLPAGTPTYNVNAKWVTDKGSQVHNVKAYGATGNGTTDDTAAIVAAITAAGIGGTVLFPPGNYLVSSQLQTTYNFQSWWGYGANITCNLSSATDCILIGITGRADSYTWTGISIHGLQVTPGTNTGANSAIRDNGAETHFYDVHGGGNTGYGFAHFIENDNDQAEAIDHLYGITGSVACNATYCGSILWGPSGVDNAGITWVQNSDFGSNCTANGIDWQTGNHLTISRSILQAWKQYAVRIVSSSLDVDGNTHWEQSGSCVNPLNDGNGHALGTAGLIALGTNVTIEGLPAGGTNVTGFSTNAVGGSTNYTYYIVGHAAGGATAPLLAGFVGNGGSTVSGSAENFLVWPALSATSVTSYDILRTTGTPPYGTGNYLVASVAASTACGANGVCAYTDSTGTLTSYTIPSPENLYPIDQFWTGNLVLFSTASNNSYYVASYVGPQMATSLVNSAPSDQVETHVKFTGVGNFNNLGGVNSGPGFIAQGNGYSADAQAVAQLIQRGQPFYSTKGWFNFGFGGYYAGPVANDYLTLYDSNYQKTLANYFSHPGWDAADSAICGDPPNSSGVCFRGPTVSQYIGVLPDGSHWTTRTYSTGIADTVTHYGLTTTNVGTPNTPTLVDVSAASTCQRSYGYSIGSVCFDGTNFELVVLGANNNNGSYSGATAPSWATTPGAITVDWQATFENLGTGSLAANTAYYFKTAGCTVAGCSGATSEATVTTANDGAAHMVLLSGASKVGHTSYQVGCSTTTGTEAILTAPFTGAYTGVGYWNTTHSTTYYALPAMGCSGSGSFGASDATGHMSPAGGFTEPCGVGLYNGGSAITAGTYTLSGRCQNVWTGTLTVTSVACYADGGSSTANVATDGSVAVLTGAITGSAGVFTSGTLSGTPSVANGHWFNWTFVADGTTKDIHCNMVLSHANNN